MCADNLQCVARNYGKECHAIIAASVSNRDKCNQWSPVPYCILLGQWLRSLAGSTCELRLIDSPELDVSNLMTRPAGNVVPVTQALKRRS